jgi:hypothetical protein
MPGMHFLSRFKNLAFFHLSLLHLLYKMLDLYDSNIRHSATFENFNRVSFPNLSLNQII